MSSPEQKPTVNESQPVKKRSPMERAVVWGGILILLAVLAFEAMSSNQYNSTLKDLEVAIHSKTGEFVHVGIPASDLAKYIKGSPIRTEESSQVLVARDPLLKGQKRVLLQWPSLFKLYKIAVTIDQKETAYFVEAITSSAPEVPDKPLKIHPMVKPQQIKKDEVGEKTEAAPATENAEKPEATEKANE